MTFPAPPQTPPLPPPSPPPSEPAQPVVRPPLPPTPDLPDGLPAAIDDPHTPGEIVPVREPMAEPPMTAAR